MTRSPLTRLSTTLDLIPHAFRTVLLVLASAACCVALRWADRNWSLPPGLDFLALIPIALAFRVGARTAGFLSVPVVAVILTVGSGAGLDALGGHLVSLGLVGFLLDSLGRSLRKARHRAVSDHLTGVYNRRGGEERAALAIETCRRNGERAVLVMVDCDGFKGINDELGHETGDLALRSVARALRSACGPRDLVWRHGGDEFAVLLCGAELGDARFWSGRVESALAKGARGLGVRLTVSTGTALLRDSQDSLSSLMARADNNLYHRRRLLRTEGRRTPASV